MLAVHLPCASEECLVFFFAVNVPSGHSPHHLQCIQSKLYKDSQLLAGPRAGHYSDVGPVSNVHTCTRLCCEDSSCDVAYMFGKNCFMVSCYNEKGCRVVSSKPREGMLGDKASKIHKTVQYIVKRKFGVAVREGKEIFLLLFLCVLSLHLRHPHTSANSMHPFVHMVIL